METSKVVGVALLTLCPLLWQWTGGFPLHASCSIKWTWDSSSCKSVQDKIVAQIDKWSGKDCGTGEKCRYKLTSNVANKVTATHTTPVKEYVDDLTFDFTSAGSGCSVQGKSSSETWYAVLDYGTNYCNLHNLITGAGLDTLAGYKESTSNSECTQYSSADCEKY